MTLRTALLVTASIALASPASTEDSERDFGPFVEESDFQLDFTPLDEFGSVDAFEAQLDGWQAACLAASGGSSWAGRCFKRAELWDRELNTQYKKLIGALEKPGKDLLKKSQRQWLEVRDSSIAFDAHTLESTYREPGTMWISIITDDAVAYRAGLLKNRTLMLREWAARLDRGPVTTESLLNE